MIKFQDGTVFNMSVEDAVGGVSRCDFRFTKDGTDFTIRTQVTEEQLDDMHRTIEAMKWLMGGDPLMEDIPMPPPTSHLRLVRGDKT